MRTPRLLLGTLAGAITALAGLLPLAASAQTPYSFQTDGNTYTENFSTIANWSPITAGNTAAPFTGTSTGAIPASRFGRVAITVGSGGTGVLATAGDATPTNITTNLVFAATGAGGVQKNTVAVTGITQPSIALLATGTTPSAKSTAFEVFFDFTNRNAGTLSFDWAQLTNGAGNRTGTLQVYTSTDGTSYTQLGSNITVTNGVAANGSFSQSMPSAFNGSATARVRFYYTSALDASGGTNRPAITIDNIVATATAVGGTPSFSAAASVSTTTTTKGTPSAGTSVSFSGANLTGNITATTAAPFEVSTDGISWGTNATIPQALTGSLFVRLNSANAGTFSGSISYSGGGVSPTPANTTVSGKALALEPTSQPTVTLSNVTFNSIDVSIAGGNGQKYLVVVRPGTFQVANLPTDGVTYTANLNYAGASSSLGTAIAKIVSAGTANSFTVTGLGGNTNYYVAAFAYNDDGQAGSENYLSSGFPTNPPSNANSSNVTTLAPPPNMYLWVGPAGGSWTTAANWLSQAGSPVGTGQPRTTPLKNDVLQFGAGTSTVSVNIPLVAGVRTDTIGGLQLANSADVTLTLGATTSNRILVYNGVTGTDVTIGTGATLKLRNSSPSGTGIQLDILNSSTGTVNGTIDVNGVSNAITSNSAVNATGVTFTNGSVFRQGAFMTGASLTGSPIFQSGASFEQFAGSAPTATFQSGSNYLYQVTGGTLSVSNRTFGNLTVKGHNATASAGAGTMTVLNNLVIDGNFTFPLAVTGGITITGNVTTMNGGTLSFAFPSNSNVTFGSGTTFTTGNAVSFSNATVARQGGGTLTIDNMATGANTTTLASGTNLAISNSLTFNAGNLNANGNDVTILSDGTTQAYVRNVGAGTVTGGSATVQRAVNNATPYSGTGYRHYSSPVASTDVADLATGSFTPVVNPAYNSAPNPTLPGAVVPFPNVFSYNPTLVTANTSVGFVKGYQSPSSSADALVVGKGYSVRKDASTVDFVGALNSGNKTLTLNGNGTIGSLTGWNLLGNPYPSGLDWKKVRDAGAIPSGMQAMIALYRPTGSTSGFYDYTSGLLLDDFNDLPVAMGFFARKTNSAASVSVNLTNAMRSATGGNPNFNRQAPGTNAAPVPAVKLSIANIAAPAIQPKTLVYFDANATMGFDDFYDGMAAGRSDGDVPTLATLINGEEAAGNALPIQALGGADVVVPMLVATPLDGYYKISVYKMLDLPAGVQVVLEDVMTGNSQDLTANPTYSFHSDANYAGQRFTLRFTAGRVTGLSQDLTASALSLYPNPATGSVKVSAPAGSLVRVFDAVGREVRTSRINAAGAEITLPLTGLRAGLYTVRAGAASQKLVVE